MTSSPTTAFIMAFRCERSKNKQHGILIRPEAVKKRRVTMERVGLVTVSERRSANTATFSDMEAGKAGKLGGRIGLRVNR
jgi:hypothetical protein